jgi:hypothetical protein
MELDDIVEVGALWNNISKTEIIIRALNSKNIAFDLYISREQAQNLIIELERLLL